MLNIIIAQPIPSDAALYGFTVEYNATEFTTTNPPIATSSMPNKYNMHVMIKSP